MRLRELRKNRGLRQKDIAEKIGVSPQSYGYYENGINKPDPEMLIKLANFFQCSTDYLCNFAYSILKTIYFLYRLIISSFL